MSVVQTADVKPMLEQVGVDGDATGTYLDEDLIRHVVEVIAESLNSMANRPLPPSIDLAYLLHNASMNQDLELLSNGMRLRGKDMWETLLTTEVQQTMVLIVTQLAAWSLSTTTSSVITSVITNVAGLVEGLRKAENNEAGEDEELLEKLSRFPNLQAKYREVAALPLEAVAKELSETLTDSLIAFFTGVTDRAVRYWVKGKYNVSRVTPIKLRVALTAVRILREAESAKLTLRWFANGNSGLDLISPSPLKPISPAEALKQGKDLEWVIRAAASYAQDGS